MKFTRIFPALLAGVAFCASPARAQLTVEITGAGANRLPVAIADFAGERVVGQALTSVIRADLERSGLFRLIDAGAPIADDAGSPIGRVTSVLQEGSSSSGLAVLRIAFAEKGRTLTVNNSRITIDKNLYKEHHGTY